MASKSPDGQPTERLIVTKIDGRFTIVAVPKSPSNQASFLLRTDAAESEPMTLLECRNRMGEHLDDQQCDIVERLP